MREGQLRFLVGAFLLTACLPVDTRPEPSRLLVTATPDEHVTEGIAASETTDRWSMRYERYLVSVGHVSAEGDACTVYSDPDYSRVLNMLQEGPQKVSILYALGHCDLDFELSSPHGDSVLGELVTDEDKSFLRTPDTNSYAVDSAISIYVEGVATKDGIQKTFAWAYRQRIDYAGCGSIIGGSFVEGVDLAQNADATVDLTIIGGTLFKDHLDTYTAGMGFQPFADADIDSDGQVTLTELGTVRLTDIATEDRYAGYPSSWTTLADYVYLGLFPIVIRYRGDGSCEQERFPNDREPR